MARSRRPAQRAGRRLVARLRATGDHAAEQPSAGRAPRRPLHRRVERRDHQCARTVGEAAAGCRTANGAAERRLAAVARDRARRVRRAAATAWPPRLCRGRHHQRPTVARPRPLRREAAAHDRRAQRWRTGGRRVRVDAGSLAATRWSAAVARTARRVVPVRLEPRTNQCRRDPHRAPASRGPQPAPGRRRQRRTVPRHHGRHRAGLVRWSRQQLPRRCRARTRSPHSHLPARCRTPRTRRTQRRDRRRRAGRTDAATRRGRRRSA